MFDLWLIACPECRKNLIHLPGIDAEKRSCLFCGTLMVIPEERYSPSLRPQAACL